jgi:hypothetical protein
MVYEMRMRGVERWWSVYALAPFVLAWLAGAVFGAISGNGTLTVIALVGLAGFGCLFWYCIAIGRAYRVVFSDEAVEFATVFRRERMAKTDIAGWSRGGRDSGWPALVVLHSKTDPSTPLELPLINGRQPEVLAWFQGLPELAASD